MTMRIAPITELTQGRETESLSKLGSADTFRAPSKTEETGGVTFGDVFGKVIDSANSADAVASQKVDALASGAGDDLHGTMIAVKEADISIKLVASIRNKLLDAFNEIWKTSV